MKEHRKRDISNFINKINMCNIYKKVGEVKAMAHSNTCDVNNYGFEFCVMINFHY